VVKGIYKLIKSKKMKRQIWLMNVRKKGFSRVTCGVASKRKEFIPNHQSFLAGEREKRCCVCDIYRGKQEKWTHCVARRGKLYEKKNSAFV